MVRLSSFGPVSTLLVKYQIRVRARMLSTRRGVASSILVKFALPQLTLGALTFKILRVLTTTSLIHKSVATSGFEQRYYYDTGCVNDGKATKRMIEHLKRVLRVTRPLPQDRVNLTEPAGLIAPFSPRPKSSTAYGTRLVALNRPETASIGSLWRVYRSAMRPPACRPISRQAGERGLRASEAGHGPERPKAAARNAGSRFLYRPIPEGSADERKPVCRLLSAIFE